MSAKAKPTARSTQKVNAEAFDKIMADREILLDFAKLVQRGLKQRAIKSTPLLDTSDKEAENYEMISLDEMCDDAINRATGRAL